MRPRTLTALGLATALALAGCDGSPEEPAPRTTPEASPQDPGGTEGQDEPDGEPDLGARPTVDLLDAGARPREELRFAFAPGVTTGTFTFTFALTEFRLDGETGPTQPPVAVAVDATVEVVDVSGTGEADVAFSYADPRIEGTPGFEDVERQQYEEQLRVLEDLAGTFTIDAQGTIHGAEVDAGTAPGFEQLAEEFASLAVPVPEEPVGPGATWAVTQTIDVSGIRTEQLTTVELVERDGDVVTLSLTTEGSSPSGAIEVPEMPGAQVEMVRSEVTGAGETVVDLTRPMPISASNRAEADQELRVLEDGRTSTLEQRFTIEAVFERH